MKVVVDLKERSYPIYLQKGILKSIHEYCNLQRKVMIVTDTGVPSKYAETLLSQCKQGYVHRFEQGEASKNIQTYQRVMEHMLQEEFSRKDLVIALGGGVVGDLAGFVASTYMRGVDFINIPTTTLSEIDSSIGGKTAIDMMGIKNCVGAFYQPKAVFIDVETLETLPKRHFYNGLVEALKAGMIRDAYLFSLLETCDPYQKIEEILYHSLIMKKEVVEIDEKETGLRKILNFGHTLGHGIESVSEYALLHGEAVALGMLKIVENEEIKERLRRVYQKWELPTEYSYDAKEAYHYILRDKKKAGNEITIVQVDTIGEAKLVNVCVDVLKEKL